MEKVIRVVLIIALIIAIPIASMADYYLFGSTFGAQDWTDYIVPCALEVFCFIAGYMIRDKECKKEKEECI
jgi:hypothetical protein